MAQYKGPASESQRVMHLQKKRERHQEEMEFQKKKLAEDLKFDKMESKFSAHYDAVETNLKVFSHVWALLDDGNMQCPLSSRPPLAS